MASPFDHAASPTPILVGVGQFSERLGEDSYAARSAVELAAAAAAAAFDDTGLRGDQRERLAAMVDVLGAVRQFDQSFPGAPAPLGMARNVPRAIASVLGIDPPRAIHEPGGGQSPQKLVTELAGEVAAGRARAALVVGAEAISTVLAHLQPCERHGSLSFDDATDGQVEDRGYGLKGMVSQVQVLQRLDTAATQYALFENARRSRLKLTRSEHASAMGRLFAPFTEVAARNPHAAAPTARSAAELMTATGGNRWIVDPYPRYVVSRDKVNQGAAVVITSEMWAEELGIPRDRWVYLRGHADLREQGLLDRADYAAYPAAVAAVGAALEQAGIGVDDLATLDLYSCFPIAVSAVCDGIGVAEDDPRGLTLTGGLPFFGGPGNDYALHAIAETVARARQAPGTFGLVGANGGTMSKYSAGVYSTAPGPWVAGSDDRIQAELDARPGVPFAPVPDGWATVETWTVQYLPDGPLGVIVGRLEDGRRFAANTVAGDDSLLSLLLGDGVDGRVAGLPFFVRSHGRRNLASVSPERLAEVAPLEPVGLRPAYEHLSVRRDGHLLEVHVDRPDARNALTPEAHQELSDVVDAYLADPELWVMLLAGGEVPGEGRVFCPGVDWGYRMTGRPDWLPTAGAGGLTSRPAMPKPVIAAIDGSAIDVGLEIALACHLVVVAEDAELGLTGVRVGLASGAGGPERLLAVVPPAIAHELVLTGRTFTAAEALAWGIANRVAPAGRALEVGRELAAEVLAASPLSVSVSMRLMAGTNDADPVSPLDDILTSADSLEGMRALGAGEQPVWRNR